MTDPRPLIAGNWKMNGMASEIGEARAVALALTAEPGPARVAICPPATLIHRLVDAVMGSPLEVGAQDLRCEASGAYTGDLSGEMLKDAGASLVILGHSERRSGWGETDALVAAKVEAALRAGLEPIVCVGETMEQRRAGDAVGVVRAQTNHSLPQGLAGKDFSVAYEPVWAIGSGLTPTIAEIEEVHAAIRSVLRERFGEAGGDVPILYGGSVKPSNAVEILRASEVRGALVGGASLKAADFLAIIRAV
ncbi:MAG TPA: triose-phosphate isomerase [Caulobacteraceae bacterium]|jgi:triosephosphate isomerase|nr:triose-phosphate isomerase [Caulobacteraceae bacterium]